MAEPIKFKYPWRAYQKRVLDHLAQYRDDGSIHVVAPPGAGKTVLGLEVVRRTGKPTLILAPSLTIRAQWGQRYVDDFGADPATISNNLDAPSATTIVTYQAIFEYHKRNGLKGLEWVELLVVDECHHLRNAWWKVLNELRKTHRPELLALTATPPYDVSGGEWKRYHQFCGEIDEEISVPELVASGDLCPHQDYLYPVLPPASETDRVNTWQTQKRELLLAFRERSGLAFFLQTHPWLSEPEKRYKDIFDHPEYFTALLSVLRAQGSEPPAAALGILHGEMTLAPELNDHWATIFLRRALREDEYFMSEEGKALLRPFRRRLTTMAAWHKGKLRLDHDLPPGKPTDVQAADAARAKLDALVEIARIESEDLGGKLRMVFLTDFIYPELLPTTEFDLTELTKVGTSPVFEALRRQTDAQYAGQLCVLTGSLVIIPATAVSRLLEMAYDELPNNRVINTEALFPASRYVKVSTGGLAARYSVGWITRLLEEGLIRIIVGTKSLLGEGWDAPVINTLVLASEVGSFVLSNQMRGRAIRTVRGEPDKTANIWHPVVIHPGVARGGPDLKKLRRRMKAFAGPRHDDKPVIQNGLARFGLELDQPTHESVGQARNRNLKQAANRSGLIKKWERALATGDQLIEAIKPKVGTYYERKDPLTVYHRESIGRHFADDYTGFLMMATVITALTAGPAMLSMILGSITWNVAFLMAGVSVFCLFFVRQRFVQLKKQAVLMGVEIHIDKVAENHWVFLVLTAIVALIIVGNTSALVFGTYCLMTSLGILIYQSVDPPTKTNHALKRVEILSNGKERLLSYGTSLAKVMAGADLFHSATPHQLRLEEDGDEVFLYLDDAEHHDAHLFAGALSELMSPVENPRYLLKLRAPEDWAKGEYFIAVPSALGNKAGAGELATTMSERIGEQLDPVYTREPSGRLHLLTARLQATEMGDLVAERDMLWR